MTSWSTDTQNCNSEIVSFYEELAGIDLYDFNDSLVVMLLSEYFLIYSTELPNIDNHLRVLAQKLPSSHELIWGVLQRKCPFYETVCVLMHRCITWLSNIRMGILNIYDSAITLIIQNHNNKLYKDDIHIQRLILLTAMNYTDIKLDMRYTESNHDINLYSLHELPSTNTQQYTISDPIESLTPTEAYNKLQDLLKSFSKLSTEVEYENFISDYIEVINTCKAHEMDVEPSCCMHEHFPIMCVEELKKEHHCSIYQHIERIYNTLKVSTKSDTSCTDDITTIDYDHMLKFSQLHREYGLMCANHYPSSKVYQILKNFYDDTLDLETLTKLALHNKRFSFSYLYRQAANNNHDSLMDTAKKLIDKTTNLKTAFTESETRMKNPVKYESYMQQPDEHQVIDHNICSFKYYQSVQNRIQVNDNKNRYEDLAKQLIQNSVDYKTQFFLSAIEEQERSFYSQKINQEQMQSLMEIFETSPDKIPNHKRSIDYRILLMSLKSFFKSIFASLTSIPSWFNFSNETKQFLIDWINKHSFNDFNVRRDLSEFYEIYSTGGSQASPTNKQKSDMLPRIVSAPSSPRRPTK